VFVVTEMMPDLHRNQIGSILISTYFVVVFKWWMMMIEIMVINSYNV
jgi:hypothetical protein